MKKLILLFILIAVNYTGRASHIAGGYITYRFTGNPAEYEITLTVYRDCDGIPMPVSDTVCLSSSFCGYYLKAGLSLQPGFPFEITQCIPPPGPTSCQGGVGYGIEKYEYTGTVTLPLSCNDWHIDYSFQLQNGGLGNGAIYSNLRTMLNNLDFPQNSSPVINNDPCFVGCVQLNNCFTLNVSDTNNNSFYFQKTLIDTAQGPYCPAIISGQMAGLFSSFFYDSLSVDSLSGMFCVNIPIQSVNYYSFKITENLNSLNRPYIKPFFIYNIVANCPLSINELENQPVFYCTVENGFLTLNYTLAEPVNINIELIGTSGQKLKTLYKGKTSVEKQEQKFSLKEYPAGIYFVKMNVDGKEEVRKVVKM